MEIVTNAKKNLNENTTLKSFVLLLFCHQKNTQHNS